jgi:hypothetical protein
MSFIDFFFIFRGLEPSMTLKSFEYESAVDIVTRTMRQCVPDLHNCFDCFHWSTMMMMSMIDCAMTTVLVLCERDICLAVPTNFYCCQLAISVVG